MVVSIPFIESGGPDVPKPGTGRAPTVALKIAGSNGSFDRDAAGLAEDVGIAVEAEWITSICAERLAGIAVTIFPGSLFSRNAADAGRTPPPGAAGNVDMPDSICDADFSHAVSRIVESRWSIVCGRTTPISTPVPSGVREGRWNICRRLSRESIPLTSIVVPSRQSFGDDTAVRPTSWPRSRLPATVKLSGFIFPLSVLRSVALPANAVPRPLPEPDVGSEDGGAELTRVHHSASRRSESAVRGLNDADFWFPCAVVAATKSGLDIGVSRSTHWIAAYMLRSVVRGVYVPS